MATDQLTHRKPPMGALVAITDKGAAAHYVAEVDLHLGRYFYAGCHRFHVADDCVPSAERSIWQTAAATAVLLKPEEYEAAGARAIAAPAPSSDATPMPGREAVPLGPAEPTEEW